MIPRMTSGAYESGGPSPGRGTIGGDEHDNNDRDHDCQGCKDGQALLATRGFHENALERSEGDHQRKNASDAENAKAPIRLHGPGA